MTTELTEQALSPESIARQLVRQVDDMLNELCERKCSEQIELVLVDHFADIALADRSDINNLLVQARRDGRLTCQQFDQGRVVDIIASGVPIGDQSEIHVVVEVSVTINEQDVHNARRRAVLLQNLTGVNTKTFCVANAP